MRSGAPTAITLLLAATLVCSAATAQTLYRWVDKDGRVHYTQQRPPPSDARNLEQRRMGPPAAAEANTGTGGQIPFAVKQAMTAYPVILYTSPGCKSGCPEARALLQKRGVPFREISVSEQDMNDFLKKISGDNKVPVLTVGSSVQKGFEEGAFNEALDTAGYPATSQFTGGTLPQPPEPPGLPKPAPPESAESAPAGAAPPAEGQPAKSPQ